MTRTLIVMARAPAYGQGKTRLASGVGRAAALRINRALQAHTMRVAVNRGWTTVLAVTPDHARNLQLPGVWPRGVKRVVQGGGDLGARLARVVRRVRGSVVLIGTDCPDISPRDIALAMRALGRAPVVIGPADDGGFWILAARRACDLVRAFADVRWSTAHTLDDLSSRLHVDYLHIRTLPDIDTVEDWRAYRARKRR